MVAKGDSDSENTSNSARNAAVETGDIIVRELERLLAHIRELARTARSADSGGVK